jgi:hypothetical protein
MTEAGFLDLPDDVVQAIFVRLPIPSIGAGLCSCRRLNLIIDDEFVWKSLCFREGLVRGPSLVDESWKDLCVPLISPAPHPRSDMSPRV